MLSPKQAQKIRGQAIQRVLDPDTKLTVLQTFRKVANGVYQNLIAGGVSPEDALPLAQQGGRNAVQNLYNAQPGVNPKTPPKGGSPGIGPILMAPIGVYKRVFGDMMQPPTKGT